jgi:hypothetical protein
MPPAPRTLSLSHPHVLADRMCAGAIAYSGPFVPSYRAALYADWAAKLTAVGLPYSPHASLARTLADPVQVSAAAGSAAS